MTASEPHRVALVTGAAHGVGRAIAVRLAGDGFDVVINDIETSIGELEMIGAHIADRGRRSVIAPGEVTDLNDVTAIVDTAEARLGRLDIAVANAGIGRFESLLDTTAESWDHMFAVNAKGVFLTWQAAARQFIAQGTGGKLIAAASEGAHRVGYLPAYCASKFAIRGLTQAAAVALAPYGITADSYAHGFVRTPLQAAAHEAFDGFSPTVALGRPAEPEDVGALVSLLASRDSDYMTGQTLISNSGTAFI